MKKDQERNLSHWGRKQWRNNRQEGILNTWQKYVEELYETRNRPTILDIEYKTDISEDGKGFPILME